MQRLEGGKHHVRQEVQTKEETTTVFERGIKGVTPAIIQPMWSRMNEQIPGSGILIRR